MDLMVIMVIADTQEGATVIIAATESPFSEKNLVALLGMVWCSRPS